MSDRMFVVFTQKEGPWYRRRTIVVISDGLNTVRLDGQTGSFTIDTDVPYPEPILKKFHS